jgi:hypothetical protein
MIFVLAQKIGLGKNNCLALSKEGRPKPEQKLLLQWAQQQQQ